MIFSLKGGAIIMFAIALIPASAIAYYVHRDIADIESGYHPVEQRFGGANEGDLRYALLAKLTRQYVKGHADAPAAMRKGQALAPTAFLNDALEAQGAKWRVRDVNGLVADTFEVT